MRRLDPLVVELERDTQPLLVVTHLSTLQLLYGYFTGVPCAEIPFIRLPPHTVIELRPTIYGWKERRIPLGGRSDAEGEVGHSGAERQAVEAEPERDSGAAEDGSAASGVADGMASGAAEGEGAREGGAGR